MDNPCGVFSETYQQDAAVVRTRMQRVLLLGVLAALVIVPLVLDKYILSVVVQACIFIIAALGLQLLTGYAGQFSIGQAAFVAVGAYTSGVLTAKLGLPFLLALPAAAVGAGIVGVIFGAPSLRLKGFYLVMATLAAQFVILYTIANLPGITGGVMGLRVPPASIAGFSFDSVLSYAYLALSCLVVATVVAINLTRTKIGRNFVAVRDNDLSAEVTGVNVFATKLTAFFIGSAYAGVAGSLWAHWAQMITPDTWTLAESLWYAGYLLVGGLGSIVGVFLGVGFLVAVNQLLSIAVSALARESLGAAQLLLPARTLIFGLLLIIFLIKAPAGLANPWRKFKRWYRAWPLS